MSTDEIAPLQGLTLGQALARSARRFGEREFIRSGGACWRFAEFDAAVDRLASGLLAQGVRPGDRVAAWLGNCPEWAHTLCAAARIGAVMVPVNTRYTGAEAHFLLANSGSRLLVMSHRLWGKDYLGLLDTAAPGITGQAGGELALASLPELRRLVFVGDGAPAGGLRFEDLLQSPPHAGLAEAQAAVRPEQLLLICYTSGTTGRPKGAMHNHGVIKQATRVGLAMQMREGSRLLGQMPLYHVGGLYMGLIPCLTLGACIVLMPQWDAGTALELIERERITAFGGMSTHFVDLVNHPDVGRRDLSSLRIAWMGGATIAEATYERFRATLGLAHLLSTYGMTENTISTTFNRPGDPPEVCRGNRAPLLGDSELLIVDPATGRSRATGETGEIWCRGETVMMGYYQNPEATREAITPEGWLRTGDLGHLDAQGYLSITGRLKDMYKSGGTNVYPAEIEQHLMNHADVRLACVIGVDDERLGEVGVAFVEPRAGSGLDEAGLRAHCQAALAGYKVPRRFLLMPEMPRLSTGKVDKGALRTLLVDKNN